MIKDKAVFLTGATGFVGSYLLKLLLENGSRVFALARSKDGISGKDRIEAVLDFWGAEISPENRKNLAVIEGNIRFPDLGISQKKDLEQIISDAEIIIHCAAVTLGNLRLETIRQVNVEGTRNVLDLALKCRKRGKLQKVDHISTAYVAGDAKNIEFSEEMLGLGQGFYNTYEQSKYEAELVVRKYSEKEGLNISVFRPSMVMGDTQTGRTNNFGVFYGALHFFSRQLYDSFPADINSPLNVINIDTVAKAILLLADRQEKEVYHIVSPNEIAMGFLMKEAADYFGYKMPQWIPIGSFDFTEWTPAQKALASPYIPYFNYSLKFNSEKTRKILKGCGFEPVRIDEDNLCRIFNYCAEKGFIKKSDGYIRVN